MFNKDTKEENNQEQAEVSKQEQQLQNDLEQALSAYSKVEEELSQCKEQLLRMAAESENFRKRSLKQVEDAGKFAVNGFAKDLIEVIENLFLVTDNISSELIEADQTVANLYKGVDMTKNTLLSLFDKYGIKRIHPQVKDLFDHNIHQAVAQVPEPDFDDNTIVSVMRAGYILHDRLIKPAMVVVAKA
jgi:molecular chaperone GrpE